MVTFHRSEHAKRLDRRWHEFRQNARETAFSVEAFAPEDQVQYDLDTARITGEENPRTYIFSRSIDILGMNNIDIRTLKDR